MVAESAIWWSSGLDQPAPDRVAHELDAVAHLELAHEVRAMGLDRLLRQMQRLADLLVRVRLGDELEHLALAQRQRLDGAAGLVLHPLAQQRLLGGVRHERFAAPNRADGLDERGVGLLLEDVARRAGLQRLEEV